MLSDELERLQKLRDGGTLTEAEFHAAKQRLLQSPGLDPSIYAASQGQAADPAAKFTESRNERGAS